MTKKLLDDLAQKMKKRLEHLSTDFSQIRTGKASPSILDNIMVDYYNTKVPVAKVANISIPEPRLIIITPWDKTLIGEIEKAILKSDIGITPQNDGRVIRLPIPQLTEERRKEIVKIAKKIAEEHKVGIRQERREIIEEVKKLHDEKKISEDEKFKTQDEIQKLADSSIKKIDEILAKKEKEILTV